MKGGFFDAFARVAGIFATQTVLQQLVWILMCIVIGIFLMVACYIALKHFYNRGGDKCQICGSFGHMASQCLEMGMGMGAAPSAGCRCQLCGTFGHLARVCSRFPGGGAGHKMRYFQNTCVGCHSSSGHGYSSHSCGCESGGGGCGSGCRRPYHQSHHRRRYRHRHHHSRKCSNCAHGMQLLNTYGVAAAAAAAAAQSGRDGGKPGDIGFKLKNML